MNTEKTTLWDLYFSFLKIGGLTFGGGLAMLPMLQREVIDKHKWVTEEELLDIYAIGQCTPGHHCCKHSIDDRVQEAGRDRQYNRYPWGDHPFLGAHYLACFCFVSI